MIEPILTLSQVLHMYTLMKAEKLQSGVSSRPQDYKYKSLKSIYAYGCILSLKILSKLYKHKGLEFLEGKCSFSRHFLLNAHLHFSDHKLHPDIFWNHPPITSTNLRGSLQSIEFI